jgi:cytochrome c oxidase assembly protein subunit 15
MAVMLKNDFNNKRRYGLILKLPFFRHMEYGHRMWGRSIGAFFYIPAAYFWFKGHLNSAIKKRVVVAGALLACQGLLGDS